MTEINKKLHNYYDIHIFCCIHKKDDIKLANSCGGKNAESIVKEFKKICAENHDIKIRVNNAGCLGRCRLGKTLVIYPESVWYRYDNLEDLIEILNNHIIGKNIVPRLILNNE